MKPTQKGTGPVQQVGPPSVNLPSTVVNMYKKCMPVTAFITVSIGVEAQWDGGARSQS